MNIQNVKNSITLDVTTVSDLEKVKPLSSKVHETAQLKIKEQQTSSIGEKKKVSLAYLSMEYNMIVYEFLDERSKSSFQISCRNFKSLHNLLLYLSKIEKFILEHCEIFPPDLNIKRHFISFEDSVTGFGEFHPKSHVHALLNALIANLLFVPNTNCLIEGGGTSLRYWRENGEYLFEYFAKNVSKNVGTWDLDAYKNEEGSGILKRAIVYAAADIMTAKRILTLFSDPEWSFAKFCEFLEEKFQETQINDFGKNLSSKFNISLSALPQEINRSSYHREFYKILLNKAILGFFLRTVQRLDYQAECYKIHQMRDQRLLHITLDSLKNNKSVFIFAGNYHIEKLCKFFKNCNGRVKYLFLNPLDTVSKSGILESYNHIFLQQTGKKSEPPTKNPSVARTKPVSAQKIECTLSRTEKIQRLLDFNVLSLDYSTNHYGLWKRRMFEVIELELRRLIKLENLALAAVELLNHQMTSKMIEIIKEYSEEA